MKYEWHDVWEWAGYPPIPLAKPKGGRVHRIGHDDDDAPRTSTHKEFKIEKLCFVCRTATSKRREVKFGADKRTYVPLCGLCEATLTKSMGSRAIPNYLRDRMGKDGFRTEEL